MAAVKGSKQYDMVVVPHRPVFKALKMLFALGLVGFSGWFCFEYGKNQGLALKVQVVKERDLIEQELARSVALINSMEQEIADLQVGEVIDTEANEQVRITNEALQGQIARLTEEINFYKGIMVPNAAEKGLRIERVNISPYAGSKARYSILLTQVVDKHNFVQGNVEISIEGMKDSEQMTYRLSELDNEKQDSVRFRFRYFQEIKGEFVIPSGFLPSELKVIALSAGSGSRKIERSFSWPNKLG